ncbi:MAG: hypothetical protein N2321_08100 [Melioribacteraceae bacterium]|nr:hypothetical protein [Melioribacteraceae bacterium]
MKKSLLVLFFISMFTTQINSQEKGIGIGIIIGEPTGISAKYWLDNNAALDFGLAYSLFHTKSSFSLHTDYVIHNYSIIKSEFKIPVYYGIGGRIRSYSEKIYLGARGVAGVLYIDKNLPIDAFIEIAPVFNLLPETSLHLDLSIGVRYYLR